MKELLLIRHAQTTAPKHHCIGKTDYPLSEQGIRQTRALGVWLKENIKENVVLVSSQCQRAIETADILGKALHVNAITDAAFDEIDMGIWEDLPFDTIRRQYPVSYQQRGKEMWTYRVEQGETFEEVAHRFHDGLTRILESTDSMPIIVSHAGAIRAFLGSIQTNESLFDLRCPNDSMTHVTYENGTWTIDQIGVLPSCCLLPEQIQELYQQYQTPDPVIRHMEAVKECAMEIVSQQKRTFDNDLIEKACLVHDLCRTQPNHAEAGAKVLRKEGYDAIADIVESHHDYDENSSLTESDIVWIADKMVKEDQRVDIQQRFDSSLQKCKTQEAIQNHQKRYDKAIHIQNQLEEGRKEK